MIRIDRHISVDCDCGACPSMYCQDLDDDATPDQIAGASFELVKAVREAGWEVTSPNCTICPACIATRERDITTDSVRHLAGTVLPPQGAGEVEYAIHDGGNELYRKTEAGYDCWQQDKRHWVAGCGFPTWQERIDNKHVTTVTTPQAREQFPDAFEGESDAWTMFYGVTPTDGLYRCTVPGRPQLWKPKAGIWLDSNNYRTYSDFCSLSGDRITEPDARARFPAAFGGSKEGEYIIYKETLIYRRTEDKPELWTAHDPTWRISTDFMSWGDLIDEKRASAIAPTEARKIMEGGE